MQIDRSKINIMPLIRGLLWDQKNLPRHVYASVESLMLQYETDSDAIAALLPEPDKPGKSPTVTVLFNDNNGVAFMAGGGHRLAVISVAAQIDGKDGLLGGGYLLGIPENRTLSIITIGRRIQSNLAMILQISVLFFTTSSLYNQFEGKIPNNLARETARVRLLTPSLP